MGCIVILFWFCSKCHQFKKKHFFLFYCFLFIYAGLTIVFFLFSFGHEDGHRCLHGIKYNYSDTVILPIHVKSMNLHGIHISFFLFSFSVPRFMCRRVGDSSSFSRPHWTSAHSKSFIYFIHFTHKYQHTLGP